MTSYAIIFALALALNARDARMLALSVVVACGIFVPIPDESFYLMCMAAEVLVAALAMRIMAPASPIIVRMSVLLIGLHALGWVLDGYPPASPYHDSVKVLEHAELILCCLFSRPIYKRCFHA